MKYDVFICHANEDKAEGADPLYNELIQLGIRVWIDTHEFMLGDSIRRSIERGVSESRFGVVIVSPDFFKKEWSQKELDGLFAKEDDGEMVILPIWHNITKALFLALEELSVSTTPDVTACLNGGKR
ncbi:MAG: toll/interleukin-1 receptor domain-containing protein [bacterium]